MAIVGNRCLWLSWETLFKLKISSTLLFTDICWSWCVYRSVSHVVYCVCIVYYHGSCSPRFFEAYSEELFRVKIYVFRSKVRIPNLVRRKKRKVPSWSPQKTKFICVRGCGWKMRYQLIDWFSVYLCIYHLIMSIEIDYCTSAVYTAFCVPLVLSAYLRGCCIKINRQNARHLHTLLSAVIFDTACFRC